MFLFLIFLPFLIVGQERKVEIQGHLVDESNGRKLTDVLVVNKSSGDFVYGDEGGNYSIQVNKKDVLVFSALGYSSITFSLEDSVLKPVYFVVPQLNRYSISIREVSVQAERKLQEITNELDRLTRDYQLYEQDELARSKQIAHPISALYNKWSKREERKRRINRLKYLDRKRILLEELIRKSKLSQTSLLSTVELKNFVDHLLALDHLLRFPSQYELLAFINKECEKWIEMRTLIKDAIEKEE